MSVFICFGVKSAMTERNCSDVFEKEYQNVFKPLLKLMISHPSLRLSLSLNGYQIEYFRKNHSEFFKIIEELIQKKQIELLGGGYYDPVFPLLFPRDRTGQIDLLSSAIRENTGKRPRGMTLCASAWDSSLLQSFASSGIEYVLLDEALIPSEKNNSVPLIMSDKGKSIVILPLENALKEFCFNSAKKFVEEAASFVSKNAKNIPSEYEKGLTILFSTDEMKTLLDSGFLQKLEEELMFDTNFKMGTTSQFVKASVYKQPVYVSSGLSSEIAQWAIKPYQVVKNTKNYPLSIFDFLQLYPQSKALYDRMLYVSLLLNQSHGDKVRRKVSRDKLWESQAGSGFVCTSKGAFVNSSYRQNSYRTLSEIEKILRECENFSESVTSFDYNGDGFNEYICRMEKYFSIVNLEGGSVRSLDPFKISGNYADSLSRVKEFDGTSDGYERALFIDHLFTEEEFQNYIENQPSSNGIFSKLMYSEVKFHQGRKEIQLEVQALFKKKQKVTLRKKYIFTSSGMMIQYILKNESDSHLSAKFAVESSFSQTNFQKDDFNAYKLEIVSGEEKQEIDTKSSSRELFENGILNDVQAFLLTDTDNSVSFMFEPNENANLSFVPIVFKRPEYSTGDLVEAGMTFASSLIWDINLESGKEMEKTINFSIFSAHKKKRSLKK